MVFLIKYYNPDTERIKLHSYKFKKPGIRTQIVADMNKMIIFISDSEKCGESNDGSMFLRMNLKTCILCIRQEKKKIVN